MKKFILLIINKKEYVTKIQNNLLKTKQKNIKKNFQ
jgi:hypothetical protein